MGKSLTEIAQELKNNAKKVQLIYAFNGVGKTRLSREFKKLITPNHEGDEEIENNQIKMLYYNAFTEDLFYWDNDLGGDTERKLKIQPNSYTRWVLQEQGQDQNTITHFQYYTNQNLTPRFSEDFLNVTFSIERGDDDNLNNIKVSKGEESNFIWSLFYSLLEQVIDVLNTLEPNDRETNQFDQLEYIFIDDPVSSLDENHLIELAIDVAVLIKSSQSDVKFIIATHNPLFYNVLHNELKSSNKLRLEKLDDGTFNLKNQPNDSPFSYHLYLMSILEKAIDSGEINKYHFNFFRNILEKTSTFLGYDKWGDLLPEETPGSREAYIKRIINISSHSKHSSVEPAVIQDSDKRVLRHLVTSFKEMYHFKSITDEID